MKAKTPVAEGEVKTSWTLSAETNHSRRWNDTKSSEVSVPLIIPKFRKVQIIVHYFAGKIESLPFSANVTYHLNNYLEFSMKLSSVYNGVSTSNVVVDVKALAKYNETTNSWEDI